MKFALTDSGNVGRLLSRAGARLRYVERWRRWLVWDGHRWEEDATAVRVLALTAEAVAAIKEEARGEDKKERRRELFRWYRESQSASRREAIVRLARSEPDIQAEPADFDAAPWLLSVANGTLNLKSGQLRPHAAKDRLTKLTPVRFAAAAVAPTWERFLAEVLPDPDVRAFLQQWAGYCLTGVVSERLIVVCRGVGRNGKSVLLRVLQELLGPHAIAANPELLLARGAEAHPTELADLFGVRLAVTSEMRRGRKWDEEKVKRLTGNDVVRARRMREDFWEFKPTAKLMVAANHKPSVMDASDSFWDRIALIPFVVRVKAEDVDQNLLPKLLAELPGILNWALEGCLSWQKAGSLHLPDAVRDARDTYRSSEDLFGEFVEEKLSFGPGLYISNAELSKIAEEWCRARNITPFSQRTFGDRLEDGGASRVRGAAERGWKGVGRRKGYVKPGWRR